MEATMFLCDYAESLNGKLYIMGGGWSHVVAVQPIDVHVAVRLDVPWTATNQQHKLVLTLESEDGQPIQLPEVGTVQVDTMFEVGRPPGTKPGQSFVNTLAIRFDGLDLPSGGYAFVLRINEAEVARSSFGVQNEGNPVP